MQLKARAILLKTIKYGEKNLILQTYTRDQGSMSFFIGAHVIRGKNKTLLTPLSSLDITASKGKGDLLRIKELTLINKNYELISDMHKASVLMFLNEVLLKTIREYDVDFELFEFIENSMTELDQAKNDNDFHLKFLLRLSYFLGFYPNGQYSDKAPIFDLYEGLFCSEIPGHDLVIMPEHGPLFGKLMEATFEDDQTLKLSTPERRILLGYLLDYFKIHVEKFDDLKSREILEEVLS